MKVRIPSPLASYTRNLREVDAHGATLFELLADLDRLYPGIRFRMIDEQDAVRPRGMTCSSCKRSAAVESGAGS